MSASTSTQTTKSTVVKSDTSSPSRSGIRVVHAEAEYYRQLLHAEEQAALVAENDVARQIITPEEAEAIAVRTGVISDRDLQLASEAKRQQITASHGRAESRQGRTDAATSNDHQIPDEAGTEWLRASSGKPQISPDRHGWAQGTKGLKIPFDAPSLKDMLAEQAEIIRPSTAPLTLFAHFTSQHDAPKEQQSSGNHHNKPSHRNSLPAMPHPSSGHLHHSSLPSSPADDALRIKSVDAGKELFNREKEERMQAVLAQHDATRTTVTEKYQRAADERRARREAEEDAMVERTAGEGGGGATKGNSLCATYMKSKKEEADVWGRPAGLTSQDDILALEHRKIEKRRLRKEIKNSLKEPRRRNSRGEEGSSGMTNDDDVSSTSSDEDENGHYRTYAEKVAERETARLEQLQKVIANCNATTGGNMETRREYFDIGQRIKQAKEEAARARRANLALSAIEKKKDPLSAGTSLRELLGLTTPSIASTSAIAYSSSPTAAGTTAGSSLANSSPSKTGPLNVVTTSTSTPKLEPLSVIANHLQEGGGGAPFVLFKDEEDSERQQQQQQRPPSSATNRSVELRLGHFGVKESNGVVNTIFGFSPPASRNRTTTHLPLNTSTTTPNRLMAQIEHNRAHTAPLLEDGSSSPVRTISSSTGGKKKVVAQQVDRMGASTPSGTQKRVGWSDETMSGKNGNNHITTESSLATDRPSTAPFAAKVHLSAKPNSIGIDPSLPGGGTNRGAANSTPSTAETFGTLRPPSTREELERARTPAIYIPVSRPAPTGGSPGSHVIRDPDTGLLVDTSELDLTPSELRDKRRHDAKDNSKKISESATEALRSSRRRLARLVEAAEGDIEQRNAERQQHSTELQQVVTKQIEADGEQNDGDTSRQQQTDESYAVVELVDESVIEEADAFVGVSPTTGLTGDDDGEDVFPRPDTAHRQDHTDICGASMEEEEDAAAPQQPTFATVRQQRQNNAVIETSVDSEANNKKHALRPLEEMKLELEVTAMEDELRRRQEDKRKLVHSRESVSSARKDRTDSALQNIQDLKDEALAVDLDLQDEKDAFREKYLKDKEVKTESWRQPFVPKHPSEWEVEAEALRKKASLADDEEDEQEKDKQSSGRPTTANRLVPSVERDEDNEDLSPRERDIAHLSSLDPDTRAGYALMREAAIQRLDTTTEPALRHALYNRENTEFLILWQLWHDTVCSEDESRKAYETEESTYRRALQSHAHSSFSKAEEIQQMPEVLRDLLAPPSASLGGFPNSAGAGVSRQSRSAGSGGGVRPLSDTLLQYDRRASAASSEAASPPAGAAQPESPPSRGLLPPLSPQRRTSATSTTASPVATPQQRQARLPSTSARSSSANTAGSPNSATTTGHHLETIQLVEECNILREELLTYSRDKLKWKQEKRKLRQEYLTMCIERGIRPFADVYVDDQGKAHFVNNGEMGMFGGGDKDEDGSPPGGVDRLSISNNSASYNNNTNHSRGGTAASSSGNVEIAPVRRESGSGTNNNSQRPCSPYTGFPIDTEVSRPPSRAITDLDDDVVIHMMNSRPATAADPSTPVTAVGGGKGRVGKPHSNSLTTGTLTTTSSSNSRPSTIPTVALAVESDPLLALRRRLEVVQWSVDDTEQREVMAKKRLQDLSAEVASSQ